MFQFSRTLYSFILFFILSLSIILPNQLYAFADTATVKVDALNVRNGPGLSYNVISQIKKGASYSITNREADWVEIELTSQKGWVANWLVDIEEHVVKSEVSIESTVDSLRVRKGPGTNFQIIGSINKGEHYLQLDENENWSKLEYNNEEGWVYKTYIQKVKNEHSQNNDLVNRQLKIEASILNVRASPTLTASIVGKLKAGEEVNYIKYEDGWYLIQFQQKEGWVSGNYVQVLEEPQKTPAKPTIISEKMITTASNLNLREEPSLQSSIIDKLKDGSIVHKVKTIGDWSSIQFNEKNGWVYNQYLKALQGEAKLTILHNGTNIRSGPSTSTDVVQRANNGDIFSIVKKHGDWYEIILENGNHAYIAGWIVEVSGPVEKVERPGVEKNLKGKTIVIDPGHGGKDGGATGLSGTVEKDLTYKTSKLLADKLKAAGANVIITRNSDNYITLQYRVSLSHYHKADAFISIHYDSIRLANIQGISTFYYDKEKDYKLGRLVHKELVSATGLKNRKLKYGNYHILRENKQPSILLELGFLSNKREELVINTNDYQEKATKAIYKGLIEYFK